MVKRFALAVFRRPNPSDSMAGFGRNWRLIVTPPAGGAENMALDEALMERARVSRDWILRVYSWAAPTISFGRNQIARDKYDLDRMTALGLHVVRRPTGGRAILHNREITYSVAAAEAEAGELLDSYSQIHVLLQQALRRLGIDSELAAYKRGIVPGMVPCFNEPSGGELVVGGRKLAGSAQWRTDGALLQHGSILVGDDQTLLAGLALDPGPSIPAPATLTDLLGEAPTVTDIAEALAATLESDHGVRPTPLERDDELRARTAALVVRYLDDAWTWRR